VKFKNDGFFELLRVAWRGGYFPPVSKLPELVSKFFELLASDTATSDSMAAIWKLNFDPPARKDRFFSLVTSELAADESMGALPFKLRKDDFGAVALLWLGGGGGNGGDDGGGDGGGGIGGGGGGGGGDGQSWYWG
jgi:hypothetical protein